MKKNYCWKNKTLMGPLIALSFLAGMVWGTSAIAASGLPKFEIVGRNSPGALSIVVPQNTTSEQLKMLILQFRAARKSNSLSTMIPATTPGGNLGDYATVWVFVLTEHEWAATDKFQRFMRTSSNSFADREYSKKYAKHIKAEYFYATGGIVGTEEYGNLGYEDGLFRSSNYKKLF